MVYEAASVIKCTWGTKTYKMNCYLFKSTFLKENKRCLVIIKKKCTCSHSEDYEKGDDGLGIWEISGMVFDMVMHCLPTCIFVTKLHKDLYGTSYTTKIQTTLNSRKS